MNKQPGIWRFARRLNPPVGSDQRLTLGEGNTVLEKIDGIYFKREDQNPLGSVKDRGMAFQISKLIEYGYRKLVISSSGNAGISAGEYCKLVGAKLTVFVSPKISSKKLKRLNSCEVEIVKNLRAVSESHRYAKENDLYNLRPSKDILGSVGYETIAYELQERLPDAGAIFFPVSSATTLVGVGKGFEKVLNNKIQLHVVQTTKVHPIAKIFDQNFETENTSLATGLVAKVVPRKDEAINLVKRSGGFGWVVSNGEILKANEWLRMRGVKTSYEGATALAGYFKARKSGWVVNGHVVVLLTGSL